MASGAGSGERNSKGEISSGRDRHRDGRDNLKDRHQTLLLHPISPVLRIV